VNRFSMSKPEVWALFNSRFSFQDSLESLSTSSSFSKSLLEKTLPTMDVFKS
jgi:hypothetical protein